MHARGNVRRTDRGEGTLARKQSQEYLLWIDEGQRGRKSYRSYIKVGSTRLRCNFKNGMLGRSCRRSEARLARRVTVVVLQPLDDIERRERGEFERLGSLNCSC